MNETSSRGWIRLPGRADTICAVLLIAAATAITLPSLGGDFLNWDDDRFIVDNPHVSELSSANLEWAFEDVRFELYQPLYLVSFMVDGSLWGGNPTGYRVHNLVLFALGCLLLFALLRRLGMSPTAALVGALFFAVAPYRMESVAWISSRKDMLVLVLGLLCWHLHLGASQTARRRLLMGLGATILFLAALLAKSAAVVLPGMILAVDLGIRKKTPVRYLLRSLPYAIPAAVIAFAAPVLWSQADLIHDAATEGAIERISLIGWSLAHYAKTALWPFGLSPIYAGPEPSNLARAIASTVVLLAILAVLILARMKKRRVGPPLAALLVFAVGVLPYLNIVQIYYTVSDRYLLLGSFGISIGASLIATWATSLGKRYRAMLGIGTLAILLSWGLAAAGEAAAWSNPEKLWEHATTRQPDSFFARLKYGETLRKLERPSESMEQYQEARRIRPGSPTALAGVFWGALLVDAQSNPLPPNSEEKLVGLFLSAVNDGNKMEGFADLLNSKGYPGAADVVMKRHGEWATGTSK